MTPKQKRAIVVRQIDSRMKKYLEEHDRLIRNVKNCSANTLARLCRNVAATAHNLSMKTEELLAIDKELGDA